MKRLLFVSLFSLTTLFSGSVYSQTAEQSIDIAPKPIFEVQDAVPASDNASTTSPSATADATTVEPVPTNQPIKIAFILPQKGSRFDAVTQYALDGLLAANYAKESPNEILLIRPGDIGTVEEQLLKAAEAGAMVAVGPLERNAVETIGKLPYLPLPVIALNQIELDNEIPLTPEEIEEERIAEESRKLADQALRELNQSTERVNEPMVSSDSLASSEKKSDAANAGEVATTEVVGAEGVTEIDPNAATVEDLPSGAISSATKVPGLVLAQDMPKKYVRYEPKLFPRGLLMMGLSMEADADYIADLGISALPRLTEAGERPKVLILDQNSPLEKRISEAFQKRINERGFTADRLTINLTELQRINQFFELVVEEDDPEIDPEEPIDQELNPLGWRQQQLRMRREEAEKRAQAAFAEPPYYAVFMALDANTASQIRPRLPIRTRVWGTPSVYPGDPLTNSAAKALTYDLKQVGFVDCPFVLDFDLDTFEEKYKVPAPAGLVQKRLFALGADALEIACGVARGEQSKTIPGLTGTLTYDLETSPVVTRHGTTAMIVNGSIKLMPEEQLINYQVVTSGMKAVLKRNLTALSEKDAQARELQEAEQNDESSNAVVITEGTVNTGTKNDKAN